MIKDNYRLVLYFLILALLFTSCKSAEKWTTSGYAFQKKGNYSEAEKAYLKALKKEPKHESALNNLFNLKYSQGRYEEAYKYAKANYSYNRNGNSIYSYARASSINNNEQQTMYLLFELSLDKDFDFHRKSAAKEPDFNSLKSLKKFQRFLAGYRRLEITPFEGYSTYADKGTENDLFAVVTYNKTVILATKPSQDMNRTIWLDESVILDYKLGSPISFSLFDQDIYSHDKLVNWLGPVVTTGTATFQGNGYIKLLIQDTELLPATSGVKISAERNLLKDLLLGAGAAYLINSAKDIDKTFLIKLFNCSLSQSVANSVSGVTNSAIIEEVYNSIVEKRGPSVLNISNSVFTNILIDELKKRGHNDIALIIESAGFASCLIE